MLPRGAAILLMPIRTYAGIQLELRLSDRQFLAAVFEWQRPRKYINPTTVVCVVTVFLVLQSFEFQHDIGCAVATSVHATIAFR